MMEYKINVFKIKEETLMLKEKLLEDLKMSMKEKNEVRKNAVQMVRAAILQVEKDNGITIEDEKIIQIIAKEVKKRKDSLDDYIKGGREDIVKQVEEEISILSEYLPKQLSKEDIEKMVKEIIEQVGAESIKDMGKVMKEAKEKIGARADGKAINEVVKELLA